MPITPQQLLESALTRHRGVLSCDIVFGDDAGASVGHDDREAPFVMDGESGEQQGILISITDEDAERLCAIVRVAEDSDVLVQQLGIMLHGSFEHALESFQAGK